jgi:hypothetical protein
VKPRVGLDEVEKRKFLTIPGLELQPLGRPACSHSLYRLRYLGSYNETVHQLNIDFKKDDDSVRRELLYSTLGYP